MNCNNLPSIDKIFIRGGVYIAKKFYQDSFSYTSSPQLRKRHIKYHADILEFMVDVIQYIFEAAARNGFKVSP